MKRRSSSNPPPERIFFTDRDLGRAFPDALAAAGQNVIRHDDRFDPLTLDTTWLKEAGARGWIALSHNTEIRYNRDERDMAMRAGVRLFMLVGKATHATLTRNLIQTLPKVHKFLDSHDGPFIAKLYRAPEPDLLRGKPGSIEMWVTYENWLQEVSRR